MVTLTKKASEEFKKLLTTRNLPESTRVRVGVEPVPEQEGNLRVFLAFDTQPTTPEDEIHKTEDIEVVVQKQLAQHLGDLRIDYVQQGPERGDFVLRRAEEQREA